MDFVTEFIRFLLEAVFWYFVIMLLTIPLRRRLETKKTDIEDAVTKLMKRVHSVSVEKHGDVYYWFDAESDEFLAQGKTTSETVAQLKSRFPTHIFLVRSKDTQFKLSAPTWEFTPLETK